MKGQSLLLLLVSASVYLAIAQNPPIMIAFHWHLHQPIYYPYESVVDTINANRFDFSVLEVFTDRTGPYNGWPVDSVQAAQQGGLQHCGAQVSFSGALQENLLNLQNSSLTNSFQTWNQRWLWGQKNLKTSLGNPALYFTAFGYHHPLMGLTEPTFVTIQILLHRLALSKNFQVPQSELPTGLFPPENAFSPRMIPALLDAGITWVLIDNIHFDRAHMDYPFTSGSNLYPPNPADQRNNQSTSWLQLDNLWAPGKVSAPFGYRPYWIEYVDPATGESYKIIGVPGARYEGVEDGRGGFGALLYQQVMSQYAYANTNATRPMLVLLAHDGDNYGGGTDSYYHGNFNNFVSWAQGVESQFECTTVDDYLERFPVPEEEVIWVEDGSWSGANNGDPQWMKWDPDFFSPIYEPERNSWAVMVAAANRILTANAIAPWKNLNNIWTGEGSLTEQALHYFLCGEASDYWYWPTVQVWNSDPTVAANLAMSYADKVIQTGKDTVGPTIFQPQREFWNPGAVNWNPQKPDPSDFGVWTAVYDVSDVSSVVLYVRISPGQIRPLAQNLLYSGNWVQVPMTRVPLSGKFAPETDPLPEYIADLFVANITGLSLSLVDYYVYAVDTLGNSNRTPIEHVYVDKYIPKQ